jgi:hypothetical protein
MSASGNRSGGSSSPKSLKDVISHDYGIPGVSPKAYVPIFVVSVILWIMVVPNWYLPGSNDVLLFLSFVGVMTASSTVSPFSQRQWRRWRK